jgi:MFS family permease
VAEATGTMTVREVLRLPDFRKLFVAQAISDVGDGLAFLTLLLLVNNLTHSTMALAIMSIAVAVPGMTIGLVAGAYADRLDRRRIMIVSDSIRAVLVLGFVVVGTVERLPIAFVLAFAEAAIGTFFRPARGALVPRVVPPEGLLAANSASQISNVIAYLVGTGLAGFIVGVSGDVWPAFVIDALTFVASALIVWRVSPELGRARGEHGAESGIGSSVGVGLRTIGASRVLLATVAGTALAMLGLGAVNVLFVPFLINTLHESAAWAGPIQAAQTASMILAGALVATLAARLSSQRIITIAMVAIAALCFGLAVAPNVQALLILLFLAGWFVTPLQAATSTILQTNAADHVRGRVLAAFQAATSTTTILSTAAAGILADVIGVREVVGLAGVVVGVGAVVAGVLYATDRSARRVSGPIAVA